MTRTPTEVLNAHLKAINAHDVEAIVADYSPDAVLLMPGAVMQGLDAIRQGFAGLLETMPNSVFTERSVTEAEGTILLEWTMECDTATVSDGVDTFVVQDGRIVAQTARFTPEPR
ncbi:nuclear transport factor 2 family protein [Pseudonocardia sp. RS11V-5]|uniref:nuclear transport factor 2 family protein n=1 Tax=Pseudonocardia terrae TaxID=2905831 RepID=UPI001E2915AE|nr:nuclear transport factor 2 family protein [Pseudonocardia terrae]MCE3552313.1 nuclear transport factor 2 family protein [Pseudonocardia terrae]